MRTTIAIAGLGAAARNIHLPAYARATIADCPSRQLTILLDDPLGGAPSRQSKRWVVVNNQFRYRLFRAMTTPLLPGLFWLRTLRACWPKRRYRAQFVLTSPAQILLSVSWTWGELWGYLRGCGSSCARLFY